jgi:SOS-response transcriptional repressor LexA
MTMIKHRLKKSQVRLEMIKYDLTGMPEFMKKGFGQRIDDARRALGRKNVDIAKAMRVKPQSVTNWIKEKNQPSASHLRALSLYLNKSEYYLRYGRDDSATGKESSVEAIDKESRSVALLDIDYITFSNLKNAMNQALETKSTYPVHNPSDGLVAFIVRDLSMAPEFIPADVILVDTASDYSAGQLAVIDCQPLKTTVFRKMQHREGGVIALVPLNENYEPHTFPRARLGKDYHILGVVRNHVRSVDQRTF